MKETLYQRFCELAAFDAVSGHEAPLVRHLAALIRPVADEVSTDGVGNLYAVKRGPRPGPTVLLDAHTDEIGFLVKSVEPNGFLRLDKLGGVVDNLVPARQVRVKGLTGVVGVKSGHFQTQQEQLSARKVSELYVDIGARDAAHVAELGVAPGDPVVLVQPPFRLAGNPDRVGGKALDDRMGCAVLLQLLLDGVTPPAGTLVVAFTAQEELGLWGAGAAAHRWQPDLAIALDTVPAGDTPDMNFYTQLNVALGHGPAVLTLMDGPQGGQVAMHPGVRAFLAETAAGAGVPVQVSSLIGTCNNAAALAWAGNGLPAGCVCIPRRYSHSPAETCDLNDVVGAYRLLGALIGRMDRLPSFDVLS